MLLTGLARDWPLFWALPLQGLTGLIVITALWRLQWSRLRDLTDMSVWAATSLACTLLWRLSASIEPGLHFHLFGTSLLTLMFGFRYMLLGGLIGLSFHVAAGWIELSEVLWPTLFVLILPGAITHGLWRLSVHWLPPNFFVYSWVVSFAGVSVAVAVTSLCVTLVLGSSGLFSFQYLLDYFLPYSLLQVFPEGFLTGMLMTLLVVFKPAWVATFHDPFYLNHRAPQDAHRRPKRAQPPTQTTDQPGGPPDDL